MLGRNTVLLVTLGAALLIAAAPAGAAMPFTAGSGTQPSVAIGSDGSGHVAWVIEKTASAGARIGYCRVAADTTACSAIEVPFPDGAAPVSGGQVKVFAPAPNKVVLVGSCYDCPDLPYRTFRFVSTNNGATFPDVLEIGNTLSTEGHGIWLDDAGLFVHAAGARVKAAKGTPPTPGDGVLYASDCICTYGPEVTRVKATNKLVAATNDLNFVKYAVFTGDALDPLQINDETKWDKDKTLTGPEPGNRETSLASGPNGVTLTYLDTTTGATPDRVGVRRFDETTNTFGAPVYVDGDNLLDDGPEEPDSFQDPNGRTHVLWKAQRGSVFRLRYRVSDTTGTTFTPAGSLAVGEAAADPQLAAGANGKGFATWALGTAGNTDIRVVPLDPQADPTPTPTPTPSPTPSPTPTPVIPRPVVPPPPYSGPTATTTAKAPGGSTVSFGVPKSCVAPGASFKVRMGLKAKKRKGRVVVKLTRVDFYIGTLKVKTDRRAPFVQTLTVKAGAAHGSKIKLRARGQIKIRTGKPRSKSLRATITVC